MVKLDNLFSEGLNWCHASGEVDTKESLLNKIETGQVKYLNMERSDTKVMTVGDCGISTGVVSMSAIVAGTKHQLLNRYTTVWFKVDSIWNLVAWQSTKIPTD
ncbi:hypothetical protein D3C75_852970 [compost metagenome]